MDISIVAVVRWRRLNHFSEKPGMSTWKIGWVTPDRIYPCGGSTVYVNNRSVRGVERTYLPDEYQRICSAAAQPMCRARVPDPPRRDEDDRAEPALQHHNQRTVMSIR